MTQLHESPEALSPEVQDIHRAIKSLMEELEAVDWYHQRVAACSDDSLRKALAHNRDEEIEHACMLLEWIRRNMPGWDEELKTYLFSEGEITELEEKGSEGDAGHAQASASLGIGSLKD